VRTEISNMGQSVDVVATRGRWVTLIEVKMSNWQRAMVQCRAHEQVADFICIAVGTRSVPPTLVSATTELGYGLLHFDGKKQRFHWVIRPRRNRQVWTPQRRLWARNMRRIGYVH